MSFSKTCDYCNGDGFISIYKKDKWRRDNIEEEETKCPICNGKGLVHEDIYGDK